MITPGCLVYVRLALLGVALILLATGPALLPGPDETPRVAFVEWLLGQGSNPKPSETVSLFVHGEDSVPFLGRLGVALSDAGGRVEIRWPYRPTLEVSVDAILQFLAFCAWVAGVMFVPTLPCAPCNACRDSGVRSLFRRLIPEGSSPRVVRRSLGFVFGIPLVLALVLVAHYPSLPCPTCTDRHPVPSEDHDGRCTRCLGMKHVGRWNHRFSEGYSVRMTFDAPRR